MADKPVQPKKLSTANTKQEMLEAYNELVKQLQDKRETALKPEEKLEEKTAKQSVTVADALSTDGIVTEIGSLRSDIGKLLAQLSDKLEEEVKKYGEIKRATEVKGKELQEIYEIQQSASSLAALIEAQHQKREVFEAEMVARKEELERDIQDSRAEWEKERKQHDLEIKERDAAETKRREREKEEYRYGFTREQQVAKDQFEDEKMKLEREILYKREQMEQDLAARERAIAQREEALNELRQKVAAFPAELEAAVKKAVDTEVERVQRDAKNKEDLVKKEFDGERKVLTTRIEALERTVKEQSEQIAKLSQQSEKAYTQLQDIAIKAVEGSSNVKSLTSLQQLVAEQARRPAQEK